MNIEVTQKADGWMLGTIEGGYEWQAKVYEKPSEFGINGGRISKPVSYTHLTLPTT